MLMRSVLGVGVIASGAVVLSATISRRVAALMAVLSIGLLTIIVLSSLFAGPATSRRHH